MSAFSSAIDDSFEPTPQPLPDELNNDETLFDNAYNGPRNGHWEVATSAGSFIDDRCPTVYGHRPIAGATGRGMQIDDGLAKKLMQATFEQKRAAAAPVLDANGTLSDIAHAASLRPEVKVPKPFVVPPLRTKAYMPAAQLAEDGAGDTPKNSDHAHRRQESVPAPPPPAPVKAPSKAVSDTPRQAMPNARTIRILGKNGEEAFVPLPTLPMMLSRPVRQATQAATPQIQPRLTSVMPWKQATQLRKSPSVSSSHQSPAPVTKDAKRGNQDQNNNKKRNQKENKQQKQKQKQQQERKQQPASEPTKAAPVRSQQSIPAVMSGALPVSSQRPSPAVQSAAGSCKDSGIVIDGMFDTASQASASTAGSNKPDSAKPGSAISQSVPNLAHQIAKLPSAASKKSKSSHADPAPWGFEEVGIGLTTGFPAEQRESDRSPAKPRNASGAGSQSHVASKINSVRSDDRHSKQGAARSNYQPPTVRSGSSSTSIVHSFGGFQQDEFQPQADPSPFGSRHGTLASGNPRSNRIRSDKDRSDHGTVKTASNAAVTDNSVSPWTQAEVVSIAGSDHQPRQSGSLCPSHSPISPLAPSPRPSPFGRQQTNFAGDGWISPHPLSVAFTDVGASPQSAVYISQDGTGHCGTLTYSEWRRQRDAAGSVAGSFVGSRIPSAVGLQPVPRAAYNHPPPASYVGSYHHVTRQPKQASSPAASVQARQNQQDHWSGFSGGPYHQESLQGSRHSARSPTSIHSRAKTADTFYHNTVYNSSPHQSRQSAHSAAWDHPPQHDGSGSGIYNVGLTPTQLSNYQTRLGDTISHYSSEMSKMQHTQTPPQQLGPINWNKTQDHRSPSVHDFPPNLSYPREKTQLMMPWDLGTGHVNGRPNHSHTSLSSQHGAGARSSSSRNPYTHSIDDRNRTLSHTSARSHHSLSGLGSHHNASAHGSASLDSYNHFNDDGTQGSIASQSDPGASGSHVSSGTERWEGLKNAETGRAGFQSYALW